MELMTESSTAYSVSCFHFDSGASGDPEVPGAPLVRRVQVVCHWIDWMCLKVSSIVFMTSNDPFRIFSRDAIETSIMFIALERSLSILCR